MIARVRIAPVERWCAGLRAEAAEFAPHLPKLCGLEIEIIPESMRMNVNPCHSKNWQVTKSSLKRMDAIMGKADESVSLWLCEHMLIIGD